MDDVRINYVNAILGGRNAGKTFYGFQIIESYPKNKKILIADTIDHPKYRHIATIDIDLLKRWKNPSIYRIYGSNIDEIIQAIQENVKNSLVVFEDSSKYVGRLMDKNFRKIIYDSKQFNNDILFMFHGFRATPPELFGLLDNLVLLRTGDHPKYRKNDIYYYEEIEAAFNQIQASKDSHPRICIKITQY